MVTTRRKCQVPPLRLDCVQNETVNVVGGVTGNRGRIDVW